MSRKTAAEYSFFAAVPVLLLAGAYSLWADWRQLSRADIFPYVIGLVVSYVVARLAIRFLMRLMFLQNLCNSGVIIS